MVRFVISAAAALAAASSAAEAQFVTSITRPVFGSGPVTVYYVDVATGTSTEIFDPIAAGLPATAPGFNGLAADPANRRLFAIQTNGTKSDLYTLAYGNPLTPSAPVALFRSGVAPPSNGLTLAGLAYDTRRNVLYGVRDLGGASGAEGLWRINPETGESSLVLEFEPTSTSIYFSGGLDYDATTDRLYVADDDDTGGRNIYSIDPADPTALVQVAGYPADAIDFDGIGAGNGRLYLLSDSQDSPETATTPEGNLGLHRVYDIASGQFLASIASPYPVRTSGQLPRIDPTGGGAWAPGLLGPAGPTACNIADIVSIGGFPPPDGELTVDDYTSFINAFAGDELLADIVSIGGFPPADGELTVDDYTSFINAFAEGCAG